MFLNLFSILQEKYVRTVTRFERESKASKKIVKTK